MARKIIFTYYLYEILSILAVSLMFATYVIFLRENNLTFTEIGLVNSGFMFAIFLFEVPTGVIADVFGRKTSILIGIVIQTCSLFLYYLGHTVWTFAAAEVILAFGGCFVNGALEAWTKDSLDHCGAEYNMTRIFSTNFILSRLATIVGGAIGAFFFIDNLRILWLIGGIIQLGCLPIFLILIKEPYFTRCSFNWQKIIKKMKSVATDSVKFGWRELPVRKLIFVSATYLFACQSLNMQWSLYIKNHLNEKFLAGYWIIISIFVIFGGLASHYMNKKKFTEKAIISWSLGFTALVIMFSTLTNNPYIVMLGFLLSEIGRGAFNAPTQSYLQQRLPSDKRATITSFKSMMEHGSAAIGWLLAGLLADYLSIEQSWFLFGSIYLIALWQARRLP